MNKDAFSQGVSLEVDSIDLRCFSEVDWFYLNAKQVRHPDPSHSIIVSPTDRLFGYLLIHSCLSSIILSYIELFPRKYQ